MIIIYSHSIVMHSVLAYGELQMFHRLAISIAEAAEQVASNDSAVNRLRAV